jgi:hypothetical protein
MNLLRLGEMPAGEEMKEYCAESPIMDMLPRFLHGSRRQGGKGTFRVAEFAMPFPLIPRGVRQGHERVKAFHCDNMNCGERSELS